MNICNTQISSDIASNCTSHLVEGVERDAIIMNRDDVDFEASTKSATDPNVYESLVLKTGKQAYHVYQQGTKPFLGTKSEVAAADVVNTHNNTINFVVLAQGPELAKITDEITNGCFVMVLFNKYRDQENGSNNVFQLYGMQTGLYNSEGSAEKYSDDTNGGRAFTLVEMKTPLSDLFLFATDYTTTAAMVETLTDTPEA